MQSDRIYRLTVDNEIPGKSSPEENNIKRLKYV